MPKYKKAGRPRNTAKYNRILKDVRKYRKSPASDYCTQKIFARHHKTSLRTISKAFKQTRKK